MNIGEAAAAAGVTAKMARHYESLGLLPTVARSDAGYRQYGEREVAMLRFIRQARALGFSMKQIEALLDLWRNTRRQSRTVKALAQEHIAELDVKMHEMAQMRATLEHLVSCCHGDDRPDCPILDELAHEHHQESVAQAPKPKRVRVRIQA
jgi:MerR family copper efflux transcriptional regulator